MARCWRLRGTYGSRNTGCTTPHMASAVFTPMGLGSSNSQLIRPCSPTHHERGTMSARKQLGLISSIGVL